MLATQQVATKILSVLDDIRQNLNQETPSKYPYAEWERKRIRVKERMKNLPDYVNIAAKSIHIDYQTGRPKKLDLTTRTMLFLFARLMNKSNRDIEDILVLFQPIFGVQVNYKYIERLYSDLEVKLVLHNLFLLLLKDEPISGELSGDGTGYSLSICNHYSQLPRKSGRKFRFVFRIIDLDTGMYVGLGYSHKSEMKAFNQAMKMLKKLGIPIDSISLDRYYSSRKVLRMFDERTAVYVIPKKNIAHFGKEWTTIIRRMQNDPYRYLKRYNLRNLSEAAFSADKQRFGWRVHQRREDRRELALFTIGLLHNIFITRIRPG